MKPFEDEKKILPEYPRTKHIPWLPNATRDDLIASDKEASIIFSSPYVYIDEKVDGCLWYNAEISMYDFSKCRIGKLVHSLIKVDSINSYCLGVDSDGKVVPSKILGVSEAGSTEEWINVKCSRNGAGRGSHFSSVICTPNHKFWSGDEYKLASDLKSDDPVILLRTELELTPLQEQVALGKILGDGSIITDPHGTNGHLSFNHAERYEEYIDWTLKALGDLASNSKYRWTSGFGFPMIKSRSISCYPLFLMLSSFKTVGVVKHIPSWIVDKAGPIALAFWYMDDGSLKHNDNQEDGVIFSTCAFSIDDVKILQSLLKKFDIQSILYISRTYPYIGVNSDDAEKLFLIIAPYIPPIMQYKLPKRYRGHSGWLPNPKEKNYKSFLVESNIISVESINLGKKDKKRYDIQTETGNFFANGVLVHNSNLGVAWPQDQGGPLIRNRNHILRKGYRKETPAKLQFAPTWSWMYDQKDKFEKLVEMVGDVSVFGEWLLARHSIDYDQLPSYFLAFDLFDHQEKKFIDPGKARIWLETSGFDTTPLLHYGPIKKYQDLALLINNISDFSSNTKREGLYLKVSDGNWITHRFKMVRSDFIPGEHWSKTQLIKNKIVR